VLILGPVGVGKSFMGNALAYIACRRGMSALMLRTDKLLKELKASRLDHTYEQELRKCFTVDVLILDDFGIDQLDANESRDIYEIVFERHRVHLSTAPGGRPLGEGLCELPAGDQQQGGQEYPTNHQGMADRNHQE
jgi:DNA replication protein DnaC